LTNPDLCFYNLLKLLGRKVVCLLLVMGRETLWSWQMFYPETVVVLIMLCGVEVGELIMKMEWLKKLRWLMFAVALFMLSSFFLAGRSEAASVYNCPDGARRCVIQLEAGIVGDRVKVLDEKARIVGEGLIVQRKGAYAVISLEFVYKTIRKGYPVLVDIYHRGADHQYAASFGR